MKRYKKRSSRWKRIWHGDGVVGGGSKVGSGTQPQAPDNGMLWVGEMNAAIWKIFGTNCLNAFCKRKRTQ